MAKSMKVPVLVIESIQETEILLEGLKLVPSEGGSHKKFLTGNLIDEITKINSTLRMTNKN
tara:strand:- start:1311 stop:1493 length:183 start_codon:yes stop_codon:yes gene_type:complete